MTLTTEVVGVKAMVIRGGEWLAASRLYEL